MIHSSGRQPSQRDDLEHDWLPASAYHHLLITSCSPAQHHRTAAAEFIGQVADLNPCARGEFAAERGALPALTSLGVNEAHRDAARLWHGLPVGVGGRWCWCWWRRGESNP